MTRDDMIDLEGCTDCIMYLANGELPEDDENNSWKPEDVDNRWEGYQVVLGGDENTEAYFSWRPCDVCGSWLGGNRYPCVAWKCE